jgi:hypothetical protein
MVPLSVKTHTQWGIALGVVQSNVKLDIQAQQPVVAIPMGDGVECGRRRSKAGGGEIECQMSIRRLVEVKSSVQTGI